MPNTAPSPRTAIRRKPQRGHYDAPTIHAIIDAAFLCHVAFADASGVHCLPTACWRVGEHLYLHGANNSRLIDALLAAECSVAISHLDGLVMARSAFHHAMNYRSAVIYGQFVAVDDEKDKEMALLAFLDHVSPDRRHVVRPVNPAELAATRILRLPLAEAAAKIRNWGAEDSAEDMHVAAWAGVIPLRLQAGPPRAETGCAAYPPPTLPAALKATLDRRAAAPVTASS